MHAMARKIGAGSSNQYVDEVNNELAGLKYETSGLVSGYFNPVNVSDKTYAGIGNGGSTTAKMATFLWKRLKRLPFMQQQEQQMFPAVHL